MYRQLKQTFSLVWPFLWKSGATRRATCYSIIIILLNTLAHTATFWLFGYLLKHYKTLRIETTIATIAVWILCWCASTALTHVREITFFRVINQAIRDIRLRVITQLHQTPLQAWAHYGVTEIIGANARVSQSIRSFMGIIFIRLLPALVKTVTFSIAMLHVNRSTWYFLPSVLLTYGYVYVGIRSFLRSRSRLWEASDKARIAMNDSLHNTKFSRFHLEEETIRLTNFLDTEAQRWWHNNLQLHKIHLVQGALFTIIAGGLLMQLVLLLRSERLIVSDFVVIKGYVFSIYSQLWGITSRIRSLLGSLVDLEKALDLLSLSHRPTNVLPVVPSVNVGATGPVLQVRNVTFTHAHQPTAALEEVSMDIQRGDQVAIVGSSGVGKSTLCHLLAGIYPPQKGEILLYGTPMRHLSLAAIGQYVHFVDQEATLINGTMTDNLGADRSITQAVPLAHLKDRMHYNLGDRGKQLSGGERQRVLLTRCLSYRPEILILDEALNALDEASAQELLQLVLKTVPTVILVTHRSSLIQRFRRLYHLKARQLKAA